MSTRPGQHPHSVLSLQELLRLNPEPYIFHDDAAVYTVLCEHPTAYLDNLHDSLRLIASGTAVLDLPAKLLFEDPRQRSDFRVMPCVVRFPDRVRKTVKIIGTNWLRRTVPGEISVGKAFALHDEENFIEAGFAGCILSSARTGACAAIVRRLLAPAAESLTVVGAGRVGYFAALFMAADQNLLRVRFHDLDSRRAHLAAEAIAAAFPRIDVGTCRGPEPAEILVMATDSEAPLFSASSGHPPLVISLGADTGWQSELCASVLDHYQLFVDSSDCLNHGDLRRFRCAGLLKGRHITDLLSLVAGQNRLASPALFVSTGSALLDNLTIDFLLTCGKLNAPPMK